MKKPEKKRYTGQRMQRKHIWPKCPMHYLHVLQTAEEENLPYTLGINDRGYLEFIFDHLYPLQKDKIKKLWLDFLYKQSQKRS